MSRPTPADQHSLLPSTRGAPVGRPSARRHGTPACLAKAVLSSLLVAMCISCGDPSGPARKCLEGAEEAIDLVVITEEGQAPRIQWDGDGCVAVGLFVQDIETPASIWVIYLIDQHWDAPPGLPLSITYGVVPEGAFQEEPANGAAPPLVSGREYMVGLTTRAREVGGHYTWLTVFVQP